MDRIDETWVECELAGKPECLGSEDYDSPRNRRYRAFGHHLVLKSVCASCRVPALVKAVRAAMEFLETPDIRRIQIFALSGVLRLLREALAALEQAKGAGDG